MTQGISLAVAMPAYNEEDNVRWVVEDVDSQLRSCPGISDYRIIVTNDGSHDLTGQTLDQLAKENPRVIALHHPTNKGYAQALITGINFARDKTLMQYIQFMDSDGQLSIWDLPKLLELVRPGFKQMVIGYREVRADNKLRELMSRGWSLVCSAMLLSWIKDVDCAFKVFPAEMLDGVELRSECATINFELLEVAQKRGYEITQVAVGDHPRIHGSPTGANPMVILRSFQSLFWIRCQMWRISFNDPPSPNACRSDVTRQPILREN